MGYQQERQRRLEGYLVHERLHVQQQRTAEVDPGSW